ncbi:MAG: helix-turn-helix transcriptional regulator [Actinomadura rubrobrunea]|nr:helix-turn-helix transcriptional regulator [Actinomadura rubrobrunea]
MVNMKRQRSHPTPTKAMGDRLAEAREALGLSLQAAAERAGISHGYLFKLESGYVSTPSPRVLHRLAEVLDVDYWELMELADYPVPGDGAVRSPQENSSPKEIEQSLQRMASLLEEMARELRRIRFR